MNDSCANRSSSLSHPGRGGHPARELSLSLSSRLEKLRSALTAVFPAEERICKAREEGEVDDDEEEDEEDLLEDGACLVAVARWAVITLGDISAKYAGKVRQSHSFPLYSVSEKRV